MESLSEYFEGVAEVPISALTHSELCDCPANGGEDHRTFTSEDGCRHFFSALEGFVDLENLNKITGQLSKIDHSRLSFDDNDDITIYCIVSYHCLEMAKDLLGPDFICKVSIYYFPEDPTHKCDGDVYRNVSHFWGKGDIAVASNWLRKLSDRKQLNLLGLFKPHRKELKEVMDQLCPFVGLWHKFTLGNWAKWFAAHLDPQIKNYWGHILSQWNLIFRGCEQVRELLDPYTVEILAYSAPSSADKQSIQQKMATGALFCQITDITTRNKLTQNILSIQGLIATPHTFDENMSYITIGVTILKLYIIPPERPQKRRMKGKRRRLFSLDLETPPTLFERIESFWSSKTAKALVEVGEGKFQPLLSPPSSYFAFIVLLLSSIRQFPFLCATLPLRDNRSEPIPPMFSTQCIRQLCVRARILGFHNDAIDKGLLSPNEARPAGRVEQKLSTDWRGGKPTLATFRILQEKAFLPTLRTQYTTLSFLHPAFVLNDMLKAFFGVLHFNVDVGQPCIDLETISSGLASDNTTESQNLGPKLSNNSPLKRQKLPKHKRFPVKISDNANTSGGGAPVTAKTTESSAGGVLMPSSDLAHRQMSIQLDHDYARSFLVASRANSPIELKYPVLISSDDDIYIGETAKQKFTRRRKLQIMQKVDAHKRKKHATPILSLKSSRRPTRMLDTVSTEGTVPGPNALTLHSPDLGQLPDRAVGLEQVDESQNINRVNHLLMDIDSNDSEYDSRRSLPIIPKNGKAAETEAQPGREDEDMILEPALSSDDEVSIYNSTDNDDPFHLEQDLREGFPHATYRQILDMRHRIERELEKDYISSDDEGLSFGLEKKISSFCPDMEHAHVRAFRRAWERSLKDRFQSDANTIKDAIEGQHFAEDCTPEQAIEIEIDNRFPEIDPMKKRVLRRAVKSKLFDYGREYTNKRARSAKVRSRLLRHHRQKPYREIEYQPSQPQPPQPQPSQPQPSQPQPSQPQPSQPQPSQPQPSQPQPSQPQPSQPQPSQPQPSQSRPQLPERVELREQVLKLYQTEPQRPYLGPQPHQDHELLDQLQKVYQQLQNTQPEPQHAQSTTYKAGKRVRDSNTEYGVDIRQPKAVRKRIEKGVGALASKGKRRRISWVWDELEHALGEVQPIPQQDSLENPNEVTEEMATYKSSPHHLERLPDAKGAPEVASASSYYSEQAQDFPTPVQTAEKSSDVLNELAPEVASASSCYSEQAPDFSNPVQTAEKSADALNEAALEVASASSCYSEQAPDFPNPVQAADKSSDALNGVALQVASAASRYSEQTPDFPNPVQTAPDKQFFIEDSDESDDRRSLPPKLDFTQETQQQHGNQSQQFKQRSTRKRKASSIADMEVEIRRILDEPTKRRRGLEQKE